MRVLDRIGKHEIREGDDGRVYCSCPAWRFSKSIPKSCKHLDDWNLNQPVRPAPRVEPRPARPARPQAPTADPAIERGALALAVSIADAAFDRLDEL